MSSSESEYDEDASEQQQLKEKNGAGDEPTTSNGQANVDDSDKPVSWNDLVSSRK